MKPTIRVRRTKGIRHSNTKTRMKTTALDVPTQLGSSWVLHSVMYRVAGRQGRVGLVKGNKK